MNGQVANIMNENRSQRINEEVANIINENRIQRINREVTNIIKTEAEDEWAGCKYNE